MKMGFLNTNKIKGDESSLNCTKNFMVKTKSWVLPLPLSQTSHQCHDKRNYITVQVYTLTLIGTETFKIQVQMWRLIA